MVVLTKWWNIFRSNCRVFPIVVSSVPTGDSAGYKYGGFGFSFRSVFCISVLFWSYSCSWSQYWTSVWQNVIQSAINMNGLSARPVARISNSSCFSTGLKTHCSTRSLSQTLRHTHATKSPHTLISWLVFSIPKTQQLTFFILSPYLSFCNLSLLLFINYCIPHWDGILTGLSNTSYFCLWTVKSTASLERGENDLLYLLSLGLFGLSTWRHVQL